MENEKIIIEDFKKIDLRIATILNAEHIEGSDKLLRLQIDLGFEQRQICAGIAQHYQPEEIIGKQIIIMTNLKPRVLRGIESNGMLLAGTDPDGTISLLTPDKNLTPGSKIS